MWSSRSGMRSLTRKIPEALLGLVLIGLAVLLVIPWPEERIKAGGVTAPLPETPAEPELGAGPAALEPKEVAALFGWKEPVVAAPTPPPAASPAPTPVPTPAPPKAQSVTWLSYVGSAVDAEGRPLYYLKDARNGKVFRVAEGESASGWTLVEATGGEIVASFGGDRYVVKRR